MFQSGQDMMPLRGALIAVGEEQLGPWGIWWAVLLPAEKFIWQLQICLLEMTVKESKGEWWAGWVCFQKLNFSSLMSNNSFFSFNTKNTGFCKSTEPYLRCTITDDSEQGLVARAETLESLELDTEWHYYGWWEVLPWLEHCEGTKGTSSFFLFVTQEPKKKGSVRFC